jgi:hypothetical protein
LSTAHTVMVVRTAIMVMKWALIIVSANRYT